MSIPAIPSPRRVIAWTTARLRNRPDSEHETTYNRFGIAVVATIYLVGAAEFGSDAARNTLREFSVFFVAFNVAAILIFAHILWRPQASPVRRLLSIALDISIIAYTQYEGGDATALLYPFYLWNIFGNGFRFGNRYLFAAAGTGVFGFSIVLATTPFWWDHLSLGFGLLAGLVVLPLYVSVLIRKLSEAKSQAEAANHAKSIFLASVSHELRTPLNAIIGFSDLLKEMPLEPEQRSMVATIGTAGRSLLTFINSLLDFSRMQSSGQPVRRDDVDLYTLLAGVQRMLDVQARAKSLVLALHIEPSVPHHALINRSQLEQIIVNLVGNAIKFTENGRIGIFATCARREERNILRIEIADSGIGMAPDALDRIFDRFTQADETIIDRFGGTGLGLAIVKQVVESQGGHIGVTSELGIGSTFWFELEVQVRDDGVPAAGGRPRVVLLSHDDRLAGLLLEAGADLDLLSDIAVEKWNEPQNRLVFLDQAVLGDELHPLAARLRALDRPPLLVTIGDTPPVLAARWLYASAVRRPLDPASLGAALAIAGAMAGEDVPSASPVGAPGRGYTILVAEDNRTNQIVITKILERGGHRVQVVDDGEQAMQQLLKGAFDIAILDVNMPVLNGVEATRLYRFAAIGRPRIPMLALTADATAATSERCLEAGFDACVTKPIAAAILLDAVRRLVEAQPSAVAPIRILDDEPIAVAVDNVEEALSDDSPTIERRVLDDLQSLGGKDFVEEVIMQFVDDAAALLAAIGKAIEAADEATVRDHLHALRSSAANVGAKRIYNLCLAWRAITKSEIVGDGASRIARLKREFEDASTVLSRHEVAEQRASCGV